MKVCKVKLDIWEAVVFWCVVSVRTILSALSFEDNPLADQYLSSYRE